MLSVKNPSYHNNSSNTPSHNNNKKMIIKQPHAYTKKNPTHFLPKPKSHPYISKTNPIKIQVNLQTITTVYKSLEHNLIFIK
jgi:hypothetical protein